MAIRIFIIINYFEFMKHHLDIRIANFLRRCIQFYIKKRTPPLDLVVKPTKEEIWNANFKEGNLRFEYSLCEDLKINLYQDSLLDKLIFTSFEEVEISFLKRYLKSGDCFFDIGSNIGLFTLHASPIVGNLGIIYSFEPSPKTYERLQANISLNKIINTKPIQKAISNEIDQINFHVSNNGYDALNSAVKLQELEDNYNIISISTITLDEFVKNENIHKIDLVKLDVEGWELNALKGASSILSNPEAPVFMVEFTETNAFTAGYYLGELFDYLKLFGFEWYSYNADENKLHLEEKKLHYAYENLIAIKDLQMVLNRINN
jgi:FkbM family methyltransferase